MRGVRSPWGEGKTRAKRGRKIYGVKPEGGKVSVGRVHVGWGSSEPI